MTHSSPLTIDLDAALNEEIILAATRILRGTLAYDADGDMAGIVYRDDATRQYYAAGVADLRNLIEAHQDDPANGYSTWCSETTAWGRDSEEVVLAAEGWEVGA